MPPKQSSCCDRQRPSLATAMRGGSRRLHRTGECAATAGMGQKRRLLVGPCPCLPTGQLDPDERTKDDAGAIQNLVVYHGGMIAHGAGPTPPASRMRAEHRAQEAK